jgi:hypothetical protein
MMKKQLKTAIALSFIICALPFSSALTSCSSSDDEEAEGMVPTEQGGKRLRQLTISDVPLTRATLSDDGTKLDAAWTNGDAVTYLNLSELGFGNIYCGSLTTSGAGTTSTFTGNVYCDNGDDIAVFYPAKDVNNIGSNGSYTIYLSGQKGTRDDLAQHFHYVYGVGTVSVNEATPNKATATISSMKTLLAACKFTFKYHDNASNTDITIPVKTLSIGYGNATVGYPMTAIVVPSTSDMGNVELTPAAQPYNDLLTVTLDNETTSGVYVALLPVNVKSDFYFSVTGSEGTYTGTAKAKLLAGKYYPVELKLSKIN